MGSDYAAALDYLYSLANFEHKLTFHYDAETFELSRMERLIDAMGRPDRQLRSVHVAGTKGKGSTAAIIASVLRQAGLRTGLYTSPHLHVFRERIQVDGEFISEEAFAAQLRHLRPLFDSLPGLTTFEAATALAFDYFVASGVTWAVIEVGLGGRLDATNVIQPEVAVITSISFDHMVILGDTLEAIAREKAGIIKPSTPVVSSPQPPEAMDAIRHVARHLQAPLRTVGVDWTHATTPAGWEGQQLDVSGPDVTLRGLFLPLLGKHQAVNATTAIAALWTLRERGLALSEEAIREGLRTVRWPARLEIISREPLLVIDGAHNGESMERLVEALDELFPGRRRVVIFGASADKDLSSMFRALLPHVDLAVFTRSGHPRAADPAQLASLAQGYGIPTAIEADIDSAVRLALELAGRDGLTIATGSLFTAAATREAWARLQHLEPVLTD